MPKRRPTGRSMQKVPARGRHGESDKALTPMEQLKHQILNNNLTATKVKEFDETVINSVDKTDSFTPLTYAIQEKWKWKGKNEIIFTKPPQEALEKFRKAADFVPTLLPTIVALVEHGNANVNQEDGRGASPLLMSISSERADVFMYLLGRGAKVTEGIEYIVKTKAEEEESEIGRPGLFSKVFHPALLKQTGKQPMLTDQSDSSAAASSSETLSEEVDALLAAKYGNHEELNALLSNKPSLVFTAISQKGVTLLDYAHRYDHPEVAAVIQSFLK